MSLRSIKDGWLPMSQPLPASSYGQMAAAWDLLHPDNGVILAVSRRRPVVPGGT